MKSTQKQQLEKRLKDLDRQLAGISPDEDPAQYSLILSQRGLVYGQLSHWSDAAQDFRQVVELSEVHGDHPAVKARTYSMLAMALMNLPSEHVECGRVVRLAIANAEACDHRELMCKGYMVQTNLFLFAGNFDQAMKTINRGVEVMDPQAYPESAVQVLRVRAGLLVIFFQLEEAQADLDRALAIARQSNDQKLILETELDMKALHYYLAEDPADKDPDALFAGLVQQAAATDNKAIYGDAQLFRAAANFNSKRYKTAIKYADDARAEALKSPDPQRYMRYLSACVLIAESRDRLDDRIGTLQILLTCKSTFESTLGKESGQLVIPMLESLRSRWGQEGLQEALDTYREQMGAT